LKKKLENKETKEVTGITLTEAEDEKRIMERLCPMPLFLLK
jgi:hypothetical protein